MLHFEKNALSEETDVNKKSESTKSLLLHFI